MSLGSLPIEALPDALAQALAAVGWAARAEWPPHHRQADPAHVRVWRDGRSVGRIVCLDSGRVRVVGPDASALATACRMRGLEVTP